MTIGKKIAGGFALALAFVAFLGGLSLWSIFSLLETNHKVAHTLLVLDNLNTMHSLMVDMETGQRGYLLTQDATFLQPYHAALPRVLKTQADLVELTNDNPSQQKRLEKLEELVKARGKIAADTIQLAETKSFEAAIAAVKTGEGKKIMEAVRDTLKKLNDDEYGLLNERQTRARKGAEITTYSIGIAAILAFALTGLAGWFIIRAITTTIREGVNQLTTACAEILAGTTQQASGAQEQAAAVTQTMATVNEITQTADQAAERAKVVGETVQRTLDIGKTGRKVVDDSLVAMDAVKEKVEATAENILTLAEQAQAISDIIATVNEIAEQTNLLALNAAIEASRAGEHGKGFTVVASEVKALADQSKKATSQVRQILGEIQKATNTAVLSTEEVTRGVASAIKVGTQAGDTIKALADTLAEVARATTQIVASISQQATGMSQVHQAMRNIDQVAKQNTVATRQAAQAATNLNQLGNQLTSLVGK
ncbi:MAG: CHASE3 domain-containing protein [Planctomycetes bacterium]|nr:CHASE3 domain-containing protein [Planctomycetota bacterium]